MYLSAYRKAQQIYQELPLIYMQHNHRLVWQGPIGLAAAVTEDRTTQQVFVFGLGTSDRRIIGFPFHFSDALSCCSFVSRFSVGRGFIRKGGVSEKRNDGFEGWGRFISVVCHRCCSCALLRRPPYFPQLASFPADLAPLLRCLLLGFLSDQLHPTGAPLVEQALGRASRGRKKAPTLSRHLPGRHRFPSPTETAVEASVCTITSSGKARRREEIQRDLSVRPAAE